MQPQQGSSSQPLCMQHSGGETGTFRRLGHGELHGCLGSLVLRAKVSGTYCVFRIVRSFGPTAGCARHPENLGGHTAIAFHPSSDWTRRLARSVITGESNARMGNRCRGCRRRLPPSALISLLLLEGPGVVDVSRVSDQLTYPGRRS